MRNPMRTLACVAAVTALVCGGACGEDEPATGEASEESEAGTDDDKAEGDDEATSDTAKDKPSTDEASKEAGGDTAKAEPPKEGDEGAGKELAAGEAKEDSPEDAELKARCGKAFDNTMKIMGDAGAPPQIIAQMRKQKESTMKTCFDATKADPKGEQMLECMLAARLPADIQNCTRRFGDVKPLKAPGVDPGH